MKANVFTLLFTLLILPFTSYATEDPVAVVNNTSAQVRTALMKENGKNTEQVRIEVEGIVHPRFDFNRMTALAVGKHWREATPEQKEAMATEFKTLLTHTYYGVMLRYRDVKVSVEETALIENEGKQATVKSQVAVATAKQPVAIDYVLYNTPEGWKVFNVIVEGASLVTVYRNQFGEEISKNGIDGLVKMLKNKNQSNQVATPETSKAPSAKPGKS